MRRQSQYDILFESFEVTHSENVVLRTLCPRDGALESFKFHLVKMLSSATRCFKNTNYGQYVSTAEKRMIIGNGILKKSVFQN